MTEARSILEVGFVWTVEHWRRGRLIGLETVHNLVPLEGIHYMLSAAFGGGSQVATWYVGLFEGNYTPVTGDTMATFPGAAVESVAYNEAARVTWVEAAPVGGVITNIANKATFTINATKSIYGAFLSSNSVKGSTTGTLGSAARFTVSPRNVISGDLLLVTAPVTLTSSA